MDISTTTAPRSDQQNFDDYVAGPRVVTITEVKAGSDEQPVEVHLKEYPGRPFKPAKSMRRVLVQAWGPNASEYAGRRMELVGDPTVRFGGAVVGGVRIARLSHIEKPLTMALTVSKGKRAPYVVQPLADEAPAPDYLEQARAATDVDEVKAIWQRAKSAGHMTDALNAALKPIGEALKTQPAPETAPIPGTENDQP